MTVDRTVVSLVTILSTEDLALLILDRSADSDIAIESVVMREIDRGDLFVLSEVKIESTDDRVEIDTARVAVSIVDRLSADIREGGPLPLVARSVVLSESEATRSRRTEDRLVLSEVVRESDTVRGRMTSRTEISVVDSNSVADRLLM